jgi:hypothetical protein
MDVAKWRTRAWCVALLGAAVAASTVACVEESASPAPDASRPNEARPRVLDGGSTTIPNGDFGVADAGADTATGTNAWPGQPPNDAGSAPAEPLEAATGPKCGPTPTQLIDASALEAPGTVGTSVAMDLAAGATDLYVAINYAPGGALVRVPIRGGPVKNVASITGTERALSLTSDSAIFVQTVPDADGGYTGQVVRVGLEGGPTVVLASAPMVEASILGPAGILATDGKDVYFAAQNGTWTVPVTGGSPHILTSHTGALALVGSNVLVADTSDEAIFSVPTTGGPAGVRVSNLSGGLGPVLSCGVNLCWGSVLPPEAGSYAYPGPGSALMQLDPAGAVTTLENVGPIYRLAFDGTNFFVASAAGLGELARVPADGGPGGGPIGVGTGLAIDDECLYVGDVTGYGVYSVARSYSGQVP